MKLSRRDRIEMLAGDGALAELKELLQTGYTETEIGLALVNAIAYSRIETAEYLLSLGANPAFHDYEGVYYAAHNDELTGLKFAISKGVDINVQNGMILKTAIVTAVNSKSTKIIEWILKQGADISYLDETSHRMIKRFGSEALKRLIDPVGPDE